MLVHREVVSAIRQMVDKFPVIALTGPRQSGKTTLLRTMFSDYRYVSLEDPDTRSFAENDPRGFLKQYDKHIIFDEVQRVPHLFSYIQSVVDDSGIMGQFIFSGSQNFHLMHNITQSLAGRTAIFRLFPFDFQELKSAGLLQNDYTAHLLKGFYPAIYNRNIRPVDFYPNYIETYIQRDVSELLAIQDMSLFRKFLALSATRAGQVLNMSSLAKEVGMSMPTVKAWLSALENSYVVFLLQPYYNNFSKRVIKSPKLYFFDTGLLCNLLRISDVSQIDNQAIKGALFENMIVSEYVKKKYHRNKRQTDLWFWRDSHGNEVDLLIDKPQETEIVEIKATQTLMPELFKGLNYYAALETKVKLTKTLVYGGSERQERSIAQVLPWSEVDI
ncbi:MAG: ATP-binding protein [Paludibacter sp.]|jgi:predicted AAA+ superfamily ATPase|nr:ATP-binding protein [Bacteroidales bacterium]HPM11479.1 ATP-binding protein [Paludibacter sp.]